jgi:hypothetical protein
LHWLKINSFVVGSLKFDGCLIEKQKREIDLANLEKRILANCNIDIKFAIKPMFFPPSWVLKKEGELANDPKYLAWRDEFQVSNSYILISRQILSLSYIKGETHLFKPMDLPRVYEWTNENKNAIIPKYYEYWLKEDKNKAEFDQFGFYPPPAIVPDRVKNIWDGFALQPVDVEITEDYESVKVFRRFINHLAGQDEVVALFLLYWTADIYQNTGRKNGVAMVFANEEQGGGKSLYSECHRKWMKAEQHLIATDTETVFCRFNDILLRNLYIVFEEAVSIKLLNDEGKLKNIITDTSIVIEYKGGLKFMTDNFSHAQINTNNENPVKISPYDRRHVLVSPTKINPILNEEMRNILEDDEEMCKILKYLMTLKIPYKNMRDWQEARPLTQFYNNVKEHFTPSHIIFLQDYLLEEDSEDIKVTNENLYTKYKNYMKDYMQDKNIMPKNTFGKKLSELDIEMKLERDESRVCKFRYIKRSSLVKKISKKWPVSKEYLSMTTPAVPNKIQFRDEEKDVKDNGTDEDE